MRKGIASALAASIVLMLAGCRLSGAQPTTTRSRTAAIGTAPLPTDPCALVSDAEASRILGGPAAARRRPWGCIWAFDRSSEGSGSGTATLFCNVDPWRDVDRWAELEGTRHPDIFTFDRRRTDGVAYEVVVARFGSKAVSIEVAVDGTAGHSQDERRDAVDLAQRLLARFQPAA